MIRHVVFLDGNFWNVGERRREWIGHVPAVFLFFSSQQKSRRVKKEKIPRLVPTDFKLLRPFH